MLTTTTKLRDDYSKCYAGTIPSAPKSGTAIFKLSQGSRIHTQLNGMSREKVEKFPGIADLPQKDIIIDGDGNHHHIHIHGGMRTRVNPDGTEVETFHYNYPVFTDGLLRVNTRTQRPLYEYMMVCNYRTDNPHRDESKLGLFYYVDEESIKEKQVKEYRAKKDFESRVWNLDDIVTSVVADRFSYNVQGTPEYIRQYIIEDVVNMEEYHARVRKMNEISNFILSPEFRTWKQVYKALDHDRIEFHSQTSTWKYKTGTKDAICEVPPGETDSEQYLVNFLGDDRNRSAKTAFGNVLKGIKPQK